MCAARRSLRMSKNLCNPEVLCLLDILFTSYVNHLIHNSPVKQSVTQTDWMTLVAGKLPETKKLGIWVTSATLSSQSKNRASTLKKALH